MVDGILEGSKGTGFLHSQRDDYRDFHLRVEAKINAQGDSGVFSRTEFEPGEFGKFARLLKANIGSSRSTSKTGSLMGPAPIKVVTEGPADDTWFTLEIIARGPHVVTWVDGKVAAEIHDARPVAGRLALQVFHEEGVVHFRKIEIKELAPSPFAGPWAPLFNGKNLSGWKSLPEVPGDWQVNDGLLVGAGQAGNLFTERGDFGDFHLRVEAKVSAGEDSGVFFRAPFKSLAGTLPFEAQITGKPEGAYNTGSLWGFEEGKVPVSPIKTGEWFTLEVIARGNHLVLMVGGKTTVDFTDPKKEFTIGHLALQHLESEGTIHFRRIEIKELPPP